MLAWLAFYFAFRSSRKTMLRNCAILGIIAGIVSACFDWITMRLDRGQYAVVLGNPGILAISLLIDFVCALFIALAICSFGWLCRWCFIWHKQKSHPGFLWRFVDVGWKLLMVVAYPSLLLVIGIVFYAEVLPQLLEPAIKALLPTTTATATATPSPAPTAETKVVDIDKELEKGPIHGSGTFRLGNMDVPYTSVINGHHGVMQVRLSDGQERSINFDIITYPSGKVIYHYYLPDGSTYDYETTLSDLIKGNSTDITTPTSTLHVERALPVFSPTPTPHRKPHPTPRD